MASLRMFVYTVLLAQIGWGWLETYNCQLNSCICQGDLVDCSYLNLKGFPFFSENELLMLRRINLEGNNMAISHKDFKTFTSDFAFLQSINVRGNQIIWQEDWCKKQEEFVIVGLQKQ